MIDGTPSGPGSQDHDRPQDIHNALEPLFDVVRRIAARDRAFDRMTVERLGLLESQHDELQRQYEEFYREFQGQEYSEALCGARLEFGAELAQLDRFRRVLQELVCYLPDAERLAAERLLSTKGPKVRRRGGLVESEVEL